MSFLTFRPLKMVSILSRLHCHQVSLLRRRFPRDRFYGEDLKIAERGVVWMVHHVDMMGDAAFLDSFEFRVRFVVVPSEFEVLG